jgi:bifunctional non-homologous end joining protein LigD
VRLTTDPAWCVQEKFDGRRMLVRKSADGIDGINRKGLIVALPEPVARAVAEMPGTFVFDGECVGNTLVVFDVLEFAGTDYRGLPYRNRLFLLMQIVPGHGPHFRSPETAFDTAHKVEFIQRMRHDGKEGIVFKRLTGAYLPGRPPSGGDALKWKFVETASFIVRGINDQRSVSLGLSRGGAIVSAGNVTIPPNQAVPRQGAVVEVRYLYAFPESGAVYQPVYLGERDDIAPAECVVDQLKWKAPAEAA